MITDKVASTLAAPAAVCGTRNEQPALDGRPVSAGEVWSGSGGDKRLWRGRGKHPGMDDQVRANAKIVFNLACLLMPHLLNLP